MLQLRDTSERMNQNNTDTPQRGTGVLILLPDTPLLSRKNISENQKGTLDFYAHRKYIKDMEVNMDRKKMGRPAKGSNAATERRDFRLTKAQDERLKRYCAMTGTSIGATVREAVLAFLDAREGK